MKRIISFLNRLAILLDAGEEYHETIRRKS